MNNAGDFLYLIVFLLEFMVLSYIEWKIWKSIYTPLMFLMIPYTIVLLITLCVAGSSLGFVDFYYPSILLWIIGLFIFAIPSFVLGYLLCKEDKQRHSVLADTSMPPVLIFFSFVFCLLFIWHLRSVLGSSTESLGSDEFGEDFSGFGIWGHLRIITIPLLMISIYYVEKKKWWFWFPIIIFLMVSVLNQVKGWAIIPCISALSLRLYTGKTRLTSKFILSVLVGSFVVFFIFYAMSILVVQERGVNDTFINFIFGHFFHYLTSGTLGWSMDLEQGIPDNRDNIEMLIAPIVNIFKMLTGDRELITPINSLYYNTGLTLTNVRTFFGTIYINTNGLMFFLFVFFISTLMYVCKIATICFNNIFVYTIYFFFCGLLFMGWFDFYFASLTILEIPIILSLFLIIDKFVRINKTEEII